jgi:hypothetical protein
VSSSSITSNRPTLFLVVRVSKAYNMVNRPWSRATSLFVTCPTNLIRHCIVAAYILLLGNFIIVDSA